MPKDKSIKKVLVIGSGPIVIGQAAEFDYAGAQACRVLKAEGINVVLINSNPATIMTDKRLADEIYLEPLTSQTVERIIRKERPDGLLAGLGGQTGLTIAMELTKKGVLEKYGVRLLGSDISAIEKAENREMFKYTLNQMGLPAIPSDVANDVAKALQIADKLRYPVIVRPAYTLGGSGGGIAENEEELKTVAANGLEVSPIKQVLVEKSVAGWKEIEFEVMRDSKGNAIAVCAMENLDPMGIHTGDSIVVAPTMTLSDREYQLLRSAALKIVNTIGILGGCNCQFALDPESLDYAVIEVNPRVSRSSALASKATGYPIAKISTKLALGYNLDEIKNDISGKTCACFEPALDYVAVKFPKWPFDKFPGVSRQLGTQMKATGEVMAIANGFEAALMKAVRGAEISLDTLNAPPLSNKSVIERLHDRDDMRLFTLFEALKSGISVNTIHDITKIDPWFINKIKNLADFERRIERNGLSEEDYIIGKKLGYGDKALERISKSPCPMTLDMSYKMVDTCAAEFDARTPYFYSSFDKHCEARELKRSGKDVVMVLGSGPIRIGQGIEFDYSSVHCVWTLREMGYEVVMVNNNPETVSTDYDTADRLYFEPLCPEDVMNIIKVEKPIGVVVAFGGQTAIRLTKFLSKNGIKILGTSADSIDIAEDRGRFDALLESFHISRPQGMIVNSREQALAAGEKLGYPVLIRPSYVIGGENMIIAHDGDETEKYVGKILTEGARGPILMDKYMPGTELEADVISDGERVLIPGIMEHIERAGIHSGDSIAVYPPYNLSDKFLKLIAECSQKIALALGTKGLINIQYLRYEGRLYVIEVNPRASRTVPFISKVTNIPMADLATKIMMGEKLKDLGYEGGLYPRSPYYAVKVPVFSFDKLADADSVLGPEMKSTGEVLGIGKTLSQALFKGLTAAGFRVPDIRGEKKRGIFLRVEDGHIHSLYSLANKFHALGMKIYAYPITANIISAAGIPAEVIEEDSLTKLMDSGEICYIIQTGTLKNPIHRLAIRLGIPCISSLDTAAAIGEMIESRYNQSNTELVDLNSMRTWKRKIGFTKMQSCGNDYILIENFDYGITSPEALCVDLCRPRYGIGADGIVLLERSGAGDVKMRSFDRDGCENTAPGNDIRCVAKYMYDKGYLRGETMNVEAADAVHKLKLDIRDNKVNSVEANMGKTCIKTVTAGEKNKFSYAFSGIHCVVFMDKIDEIDVENAFMRPEFADVRNLDLAIAADKTTLHLRSFERTWGEMPSSGEGACIAVAAAAEMGYCDKETNISITYPGGEMKAVYKGGEISLIGDAVKVYDGSFDY